MLALGIGIGLPFGRGVQPFDGTLRAPSLALSQPVNTGDLNASWGSVAGADGYEYQVNGGGWTDNGTTRNFTLTTPGLGAYTIEVRAYITDPAQTGPSDSDGIAIAYQTPFNIVAPSITSGGILASPVDGDVLTCDDGTWGGWPTPTITRDWKASTNPDGSFGGVPGNSGAASGTTYTVTNNTAPDAGYYLCANVQANNAGGSASQLTNVSGQVQVPDELPQLDPVTSLAAVDNGSEAVSASWTLPASVPVGIRGRITDNAGAEVYNAVLATSATAFYAYVTLADGPFNVYVTNVGDGVTNRDSVTVSQLGVVVAATGIPADFMQTFEVGSAGDLITTARLTTAAIGEAGTYALDHHSPLEHTKIVAENVEFPNAFAIGGGDYTGSGTRAVKFDLDLAHTNASTPLHEGWFRYPTADDITEASYAVIIRFDITSGASQTNIDFLDVNLGKFCVPQFTDDGGFKIRAHTQLTGGGSNLGLNIPISAGTTYIVLMLASTSLQLGAVVVLDTDLNFIGASACEANFDFALAQEEYHDYLLNDTNGSGSYTIFNSAAAYREKARIDMQPFTVPAAASVSAVQTASSTITLTFNNIKAASYKIERAANGGSWVEQSGTQDIGASTVTYTDTGLTEGTAYAYRVTPQVVTLSGAAGTSGSVTIDNTPYSGGWTDTVGAEAADTTESIDPGVAVQGALTLSSGTTINKLRVLVEQAVGSAFKIALFNSSGAELCSGVTGTLNISFGTPEWAEVIVPDTARVANTYVGVTCSNALGVLAMKSGSGTLIYDFATGYASYPPSTMVNQGTATKQMIAGAYLI